MTVARQGMPRQQLQQQSGITSHMEMLRLFGVARSVFQHSGWVTARCVEKNQGQFWPLIQEKMACEGGDVIRRNCLPAVLMITFAGLSSSSTLGSSKFEFAVGGCASDAETYISSYSASGTSGRLCILQSVCRVKSLAGQGILSTPAPGFAQFARSQCLQLERQDPIGTLHRVKTTLWQVL